MESRKAAYRMHRRASRLRTHHRARVEKDRIARKTRQYLWGLAVFLALIALVLLYFSQTQILGGVLLLLFATLCAWPIIVEANSRPRHLSGPGKNPETGWDP